MRTTIAKTKFRKHPSAANQQMPRGSSWPLRSAGTLRILWVPSLAKLDWLVHGFSTRTGGTSALGSAPPIGTASIKAESILNLGYTDWDSKENVIENRARFFRAIGARDMRVVTLQQIHSDIVHVVVAGSHPGAESDAPKGDALVTVEKGILLAVQTADCIPILLADTKRKAVAAIHAGWRGTLQRIAAKTIGRMQMEFGTQPKDVVGALGPGIGGCCYEVGHEVAKEFAAQFPNARDWFEGPLDAVASGDNDPNWLPWLTMKPPGHAPPPPRVHLNLIAANRSILIDAGVSPKNIADSGLCTSCHTDLFFSYRRERTTGRMMAAIGIL